MDSCVDVSLELDTCSSAPIGGTTVNVYLEDGERYTHAAFGLKFFFGLVEDALSKLARTEIAFPEGNSASEAMEGRNDLPRKAMEDHPALLMELARTFRQLSEQAEEGSHRLSALRTHRKPR